MMRAFFALLARDLRLATRRRFDLLQPLFFTLLVCVLTTLAIGPEPALLARMAAAVTWIAVLLAVLLALDGLFRPDAEDGSLELLLTAPAPLPMLVLAKVCAFWLVVLLPLIVCAPLFAMMLHLPGTLWVPLMLTLTLGTLCLAWLGAICAALTVQARRGGALLALLLLPLTVPVLIAAIGTIDAASQALPLDSPLLLLGAGAVAACTIGPFACAAALRLGLR